MEEQGEFGFCPKCGAVMHNGVCQSCGYTKRGAKDISGKRADRKPPRDRRSGSAGKALACIGIIAGILAIVMILVFVGALAFGNIMTDSCLLYTSPSPRD